MAHRALAKDRTPAYISPSDLREKFLSLIAHV